MTPHFSWPGVIAIFTMFLGVLAIPAWWYIEPAPLTVHEIWADQETVAAGGELSVSFYSTKTKQCPVTSQYILIDSNQQIRVLAGLAGWNKNGAGEFTYFIPIPSDMPPGPATFHEVITYSCNPIRDQIVTTPYVSFVVNSQ